VNELSLFSGAGGGLLGTKLLGWRSVGYVEFNTYCQQILAQRIKDGFLDEAPIFGDIDDFIESGAAKKYKGYVDVVTAGFPCQPFSVAGKKKGQDDERNKWPQTIQCIRDVGCRYALLENVPGLLNSGYFGEILTSLAEAGFDARWTVLGADDVGAPHRRKRLWILAHSTIEGLQGHVEQSAQQTGAFTRQGEAGNVADSNQKPSERIGSFWEQESDWRQPKKKAERRLKTLGTSILWPTEPNVGRVAHGVAHRVDRLKALGNGQVPRVAATAWRILNDSDVAVIKKTPR